MESSSKIRPAGAWFILPGVLMLAALVVAGFGFSALVGLNRQDFVPYEPGSSISVTKQGFTLYGEEGTRRLSQLRCAVTGSAGATRLERSTVKTSHGGYAIIGSTPTDLPAGQYVISCDGPESLDGIPLYVSERFDFGAVGRFAILGIIAPLFLGFCSVVLCVVLLVMRYRSGRRIAAAATGPAGPPR